MGLVKDLLNEYIYVADVIGGYHKGEGHLSPYYKDFEGGPWVKKFEDAFKKYLGTWYAIAVSSGTAALHCALEAVLPEWREYALKVLTTPYTFIATASSIIHANAIPMFGDIAPNLTLNPNCETPHAINPTVILPVHLLGNLADMDGFKARFPKTPIVEDACQALGAKYHGKMAGNIGDVGVFSFQESKSLTTLGEGGMIVTNDPAIALKCRELRNHGEKYARSSTTLGYNYRMTEAAAAFGLAQLENYPKRLKLQQECANIVREELPHDIQPIPAVPATESSDYIVGCYTTGDVTSKERATWVTKVQEALYIQAPLPGKNVSLGYAELIYDLPYFKSHLGNWLAGPVDYARQVLDKTIWFDIHRFTTTEVVKARMETIRSIKL
jgi:perosamine synthetase